MPSNDTRIEEQQQQKKRASGNMHENVDETCDTCSCEPEPRWQELGEEIEEQQQRDEQDEPADPSDDQD